MKLFICLFSYLFVYYLFVYYLIAQVTSIYQRNYCFFMSSKICRSLRGCSCDISPVYFFRPSKVWMEHVTSRVSGGEFRLK